MTDDNKEREKAKLASYVAGIVSDVQGRWPIELELMALKARRVFANYQALVKAGFTEAQAVEICWRLP